MFGIVTEVGNNVKKVEVGQRVIVDSYIGCVVRKREILCPACSDDPHCLCKYTGRLDSLGPGMILGFSKDLPGGWGESLVVHESMALAVPESVSDKAAVLPEPLSVGLHAVLGQPPNQ